jgi:hypothetical protein
MPTSPPATAKGDPSWLQAPMNVLRLSLHPKGLAPNIINLAQWRAHLFERLSHQIAATADAALSALLAELRITGAEKSTRRLFARRAHGHCGAVEDAGCAGLETLVRRVDRHALYGVPAFDNHFRNPGHALLLGDRCRRRSARWPADNRCPR